MPEEIMMAVASALAGKAAEAAGQGTRDALERLVRLRKRVRNDKGAMTALEMATKQPGDREALRQLAEALDRIAAKDSDFAAEVSAFGRAESPEGSQVTNINTGPVRNLIQARDLRVEGGLRLGDV